MQFSSSSDDELDRDLRRNQRQRLRQLQKDERSISRSSASMDAPRVVYVGEDSIDVRVGTIYCVSRKQYIPTLKAKLQANVYFGEPHLKRHQRSDVDLRTISLRCVVERSGAASLSTDTRVGRLVSLQDADVRAFYVCFGEEDTSAERGTASVSTPGTSEGDASSVACSYYRCRSMPFSARFPPQMSNGRLSCGCAGRTVTPSSVNENRELDAQSSTLILTRSTPAPFDDFSRCVIGFVRKHEELDDEDDGQLQLTTLTENEIAFYTWPPGFPRHSSSSTPSSLHLSHDRTFELGERRMTCAIGSGSVVRVCASERKYDCEIIRASERVGVQGYTPDRASSLSCVALGGDTDPSCASKCGSGGVGVAQVEVLVAYQSSIHVLAVPRVTGGILSSRFIKFGGQSPVSSIASLDYGNRGSSSIFILGRRNGAIHVVVDDKRQPSATSSNETIDHSNRFFCLSPPKTKATAASVSHLFAYGSTNFLSVHMNGESRLWDVRRLNSPSVTINDGGRGSRNAVHCLASCSGGYVAIKETESDTARIFCMTTGALIESVRLNPRCSMTLLPQAHERSPRLVEGVFHKDKCKVFVRLVPSGL